MAKASGNTRRVSSSADEWDGTFASGGGKITFRIDARLQHITKQNPGNIDPSKFMKEREKILKERERVLKMQQQLEAELDKRNFPLDVIGQVDVILVDADRVKGRAGVSKPFSDMIEVMRVKKGYDKDTVDVLLHEIGHKIHQRLFPRWTAGDTEYDSYDTNSPMYRKSPQERFANLFAQKVKAMSDVGGRTGLKKIIREVKSQVDNEVREGKLNPIDVNALEGRIKRINEKKAELRIRTGEDGRGVKVYIQQKLVAVRNGKLVTLAKNRIE